MKTATFCSLTALMGRFKRIYLMVLLAAALATAAAAQATFTLLLHSFALTDGANPAWSPLVQGLDGNLYSTTIGGGPGNDGYAGVFYKITPSGTLTALYDFCVPSCANGVFPYGGVILAENGEFYGMAYGGGANGVGTVYRITNNGKLTTLHSFATTDGWGPLGAVLVRATDGDFYGTTPNGGDLSCSPPIGCGTVFKITPAGVLTTLHVFCSQTGCPDGNDPYAAGLIEASNGKFYGITRSGGTNDAGTVFEITSSGNFTSLYSFCSQSACADGSGPFAPLMQGTDGKLYGTTAGSGVNGYGTVFRITTAGVLTVLHSFAGTDGSDPNGVLIQGTDGNFYGTTYYGGSGTGCGGGCGTVFAMTPKGVLNMLYSFSGPDGAGPTAGLVQHTDGSFYGTADGGGASTACTGGCGTVFSLSVGLGPFVRTLPTAGRAGSAVKILGTNLNSVAGVTFNGTPATYAVISPAEITTTVPAGATTGRVQVTTASGTLSSNISFRVIQ